MLFVVSDVLLVISLLALGAGVTLFIHKALFPPVHRIFFCLACVFFGLAAVFSLDVLNTWTGSFRFTAVCRFIVGLLAFVGNVFLWPFLLEFFQDPDKFTSNDDGRAVFKTKEKKLQEMQSSLGKLVEERTTRLMAVEEELEQLTSVTALRERRVKELKEEVNRLTTELGREASYPDVEASAKEQGI